MKMTTRVDDDDDIEKLLRASDQDFEDGISRLDVRDLLRLISSLQREMETEQQRFDRLSRGLQGRNDDWSHESSDPGLLSSLLCQSQIRLAQLCNRNMRCFTKQASKSSSEQPVLPRQVTFEREARAYPGKYNFPEKPWTFSRVQEVRPSSPVHHSSFVRIRPQPVIEPQLYHRTGDEQVTIVRHVHGDSLDIDEDEESGIQQNNSRIKTEVPSVEDILNNVRSLRTNRDDRTLERGRPDRSNVYVWNSPWVSVEHTRQMTPQTTIATSKVKSPREAETPGDEYDLVPTATQLLLRTNTTTSQKASPSLGSVSSAYIPEVLAKREVDYEDSWTSSPHPVDDDAISSRIGEKRRWNLSCPDFGQVLSVPGEALPIDSDQPDHNGADDDEEDDDDSGVGTEERRPQEGESSHGRRRRRQRQDLDDVPFTTSISLTPSSDTSRANGGTSESDDVSEGHSVVHVPSPSLAKEENGSSLVGGGDDDDTSIPSIVDRFSSYPLPEAEAFRRQKGSNVCWNPDSLLEELYAIPSPKTPAVPPPAYVNMEGYLEKLPSGRRQATYWNAWKRRYFRLKDGYLYCYANAKSEQASVTLQLMGGRVDTVETTLLGVDDGKGHYLVVRCGSRADTERWRRALLTHTAENYSSTYAQPVVAYPQFYEDVVIIDLGSCSVRAGILCNQPTLPQIYFPTICAKDRTTGNTVYGKEAVTPKTRLGSSVTFPLRPSEKIAKFAVDLRSVKGLLSKVFYELNVDPADYQIQLSLPRSFPFRTQTEVLDLLMTEFGVRAVNLTAQTVLSLCSYNATSGVVVDIGERMEVIPIVDGYVIESGVSRIPYGGSRLLDHLRHFLMQRYYGLSSETESFLLRYVLERACYFAENYTEELQKFYTDPQNFEKSIPVSQFFEGDEAPWEAITLDCGRFQAPEGLFNPDAWGLDHPGVHKLVAKAIRECSVDVRREMSKSIYVSGGVSMLPGFPGRLQLEMDRLTPGSVVPKVHASIYRVHAAYLGACVWASSAGFHQAKVTRDEWIADGSACLKKWHF